MTKQVTPTLAIVVPCYNESEVFSLCLRELSAVMADMAGNGLIAGNSYLLFVDDGSKDDSWTQIEAACRGNGHVRGLKLSRNKGHQVALMAGLTAADADIIVSIDADLQDDISVIQDMVKAYLAGSDIVYGVRGSRDADSGFKRFTAESFYKIMELMGVQQVSNHADFRLLSRRACAALLAYREQNIYLRGLVPLIGFKSSCVYYDRAERAAGESKYPLKKMLSLALEGITSLTVTPLRIIAALGLSISALSMVATFYSILLKYTGKTVEGWTSVMIAIFFMGGVQMLSLGIIGEYVGKIYMETKGRPKFFVEKHVGGAPDAS
ncbi:glycosyltransferase [Gluconacetobacter johannae DSM 13595]|uniref:Glycosyltransferase family 2 protein n=1 Tax=Gluconacetobacter johannae TaxID=112140 RepID=A0A7W4J620_9PROT|nr:glycosyltransferase family 2 protein [Gluconacetobacter johannae]MBB2175082.1 glycosyltransferase family 2 protein [Gluconacetobacter johannae]GBQ87058.1 glycosyltransferase [Gluconacetobacter johannae DSM 13595]